MTPSWGTTTVPAGTSVTFAANTARNSILVQNNGAVWLRVGFDSSVSATKGLDLAPKTATSGGGMWTCDDSTVDVLVFAPGGGADGSVNYCEMLNE